MKKNQLKRQGDVALQMIDALPKNLKRYKKGQESKIIARGEHSNHCHAVIGADVEVFEDEKGVLYVNAKGEFELRHLLESELLTGREVWTNEHNDIKFGAGTYKFVPQFEYHPYDDEIRRVKD